MTIADETTKSKPKKKPPSSPPTAPAPAPAPSDHVAVELDCERVCVSTFNVPHRDPDRDMIESVREHGLIEPGIVRPVPVGILTEYDGTQRTVDFEIVVGERRWKACRAAGRAFTAFVRDLTDAQVLDLQTEENIQRADLTPLQEAEVFRAHQVKLGREPAEIAARVHKSERYVVQRLKLLDLPDAGRAALVAGRIMLGTAVEVACLREEDRAAALDLVVPRHQGEGVMGLAQARTVIANRFHLRMANASFPVDDPLLLPAPGACTACSRRSSNQLALSIDGLTDEDRCLDRGCWEAKTAAQWERRKALALAEGVKVLEGPKGGRLLEKPWDSGLLDLDAVCELGEDAEEERREKLEEELEHAQEKGETVRVSRLQADLAAIDARPPRTWRQVLGGEVRPAAIGMVTPTYGTRAPKVVELVSERDALQAAKAKGLPLEPWMEKKLAEPPPAPAPEDAEPPSDREKVETLQAKMRLDRRADELLRASALPLVLTAAKTLHGPKLWLALLHALIGDAWSSFELEPVLERRGWQKDSLPAQVVMREAAKLDESEVRALIVEVLVSDEGGQTLFTFAKDAGVDLSKAKAAATRRAKAEAEKAETEKAEKAEKGKAKKKGAPAPAPAPRFTDREDAEPKCRECGCTEHAACADADGMPCSWVEPDLCSKCAGTRDPAKLKKKAPKGASFREASHKKLAAGARGAEVSP